MFRQILSTEHINSGLFSSFTSTRYFLFSFVSEMLRNEAIIHYLHHTHVLQFIGM